MVIVLFSAGGFASAHFTDDTSAAREFTAAATFKRIESLPIAFEQNRGQAPSDTKFLARGRGYQIHLASNAAAVALVAQGDDQKIVRWRLIGARAGIPGEGREPLVAQANYFAGPDDLHAIKQIKSFARVQFDDVYPGISVSYYGNAGQLEFDWIVKAGYDPAEIRLRLSDAESLRIDPDGDLLITTRSGVLTQHRPIAYQESGTSRHVVEARYALHGKDEISIALGAYDKRKRLIIDPVLSYATFLGGSGADYATAVAVDSAGNAYVTGYTGSSNFPLLSAYDKTLSKGTTEAFVSKFNATGSALVYSTFLGGSKGSSYASGIAVDSSGNAYVTGTTTGSDFPVTTGAYQKGSASGGSFVTKLGPAGNMLAYSTYILNATATGIAIGSDDSAYITGSAQSGFAATAGAFQKTFGPGASTNAFVLKLNQKGSGVTYATFIGGSGADRAAGIAVDASGSAHVAGSTTSTNFPLAHAYQSRLFGTQAGFVAKLAPAGNALDYSTYLGGSVNDRINGIALDAAGSVYVAGETYSADFPITPDAYLTDKPGYFLTNANASGAFITKFVPAGDRLVYSTFLGGGYCASWCVLYMPPATVPGDVAHTIAVDGSGHAYVSGVARSQNFPIVDGLPPRMIYGTGEEAAFVSKLSATGNTVLYSSLIHVTKDSGGNIPTGQTYNAGVGIAVDSSDNAYIAAQGPSDFTTTAGAYKTTNAGATDAVVFKLTRATPAVALSANPNPAIAGQPVTLTATVAGVGTSGQVTFLNQGSLNAWHNAFDGTDTLGTAAAVNGAATFNFKPAAGIYRLTAVFRDTNNAADSPIVDLMVNFAPTCN